jgi:uncharacterized membrane protein
MDQPEGPCVTVVVVRLMGPRSLIACLTALCVAGAWGCEVEVPSNCPNDVPSSCPSPAPVFVTEVAPIIQSRCAPCHSPGGVEAIRPFQTVEQVQVAEIRILTQIHACVMPPRDQPQLTPEERQVLLGWIVCDATTH